MAPSLRPSGGKEDELMRRLFCALFASAALAAPLASASAAAAEPRPDSHVIIRVYDPYRRDYHRWDDREERSYRGYLVERHRSYIVYRRQRLSGPPAYSRRPPPPRE